MGKFKSSILCVSLALLAGCSGSARHEEAAKPLYEGTVKKVEYDLAGGKTLLIDDKGQAHDVEGYPAMFKGKLKLSPGGEEGYEIEILSLVDQSAEGAPAAGAPEKPAAPSSEYE